MELESIAHYRITGKLGEGGMGAVYRATDTKLARDVAIKVLPDAFAGDEDRMARFTRGAQVLASLNHPNIAAVYGIEERAIVMELVEGPTLADRIALRTVPLEEALAIARQIAEALEVAHEKGIIHRDLKPANVKVTPEGKVKVLDFGLAKLVDGSDDPASAPTIIRGNSPTLSGVIMGTAGYMAPEQARGMRVDKRADIWAFGVVLFEMVTGRTTFDGHTIADQMAAVLKTDPDWTLLPRDTPANVRRILRRCLERDRKQRFQDIGDVRIELSEPEEHPAAPVTVRTKHRTNLWIGIAVTATLATAAMAAFVLTRKPKEPAPVSFLIPPPRAEAAPDGKTAPHSGRFYNWIGISPDGRMLAYSVSGLGVSGLWLRPLESSQARLLPGTEGNPSGSAFWSPDSRFLAFQSNGKLKKIDVNGRSVQTLCDLTSILLGGDWSVEGTILFGTNSGGIQQLPSTGGKPAPVTVVDASRHEVYHTDPTFLPGGRRFLFQRSARSDFVGVYEGSLDVKPQEQSLKRIVSTEFRPVFTPLERGSSKGFLFYMQERTMVAHPFDSASLRFTDKPFPIDEVATGISRVAFGALHGEVLAYTPPGAEASSVMWLDQQGRQEVLPGQLGASGLHLSPDGRRLAYYTSGADAGIWLLEFAGARRSKLTLSPEGGGISPVWSPDGAWIVYGSDRRTGRLFRQASNGAGTEELLLEGPGLRKLPHHWSPDGKYLMYSQLSSNGRPELWLLANPGNQTPAKDRKGIPFLQTELAAGHAQFSPDGRWVAFSAEGGTGVREIYVRPFTPNNAITGQWLVSSGGGREPRWRHDGKVLYYLSTDGRMFAAEVSTQAAFEVKSTKHVVTPLVPSTRNAFQYDVSTDGTRFIMTSGSANPASMTVILNWPLLFRK